MSLADGDVANKVVIIRIKDNLSFVVIVIVVVIIVDDLDLRKNKQEMHTYHQTIDFSHTKVV